MNKLTQFNLIKIGEEFEYQGKRLLKTTKSIGVTQNQTVKHRNYYEFNPECPVIKIV